MQQEIHLEVFQCEQGNKAQASGARTRNKADRLGESGASSFM